MLAVLSLWGCGVGPAHPSTIESLQIVAIETDPTEVSPGSSVLARLSIADPAGEGAEVVVASCLYFENRCAEEVLADADQWLTLAELAPGETSVAVQRRVPQAARQVFDVVELSSVPLALVGLACAPGLCPIVEDARSALEAGSVPTSLAVDIAQPDRWMIDLPVAGVSLAGKSLLLNEIVEDLPNISPRHEARFLERDDPVIVVPAGGEQEFSFYVDDPEGDTVYAYAYTTLGRFEERRVRVRDNTARHYLLAPQQRGEGQVFIVFEDESGGTSVWERAIRIE